MRRNRSLSSSTNVDRGADLKTRLLVLGVALGFLVQNQASGQSPVDAPTFDWSGRVGTGGTLRVAAVDGDIAVTTSADDQVHVHAERTHVRSGGRALVFAVVQNGTTSRSAPTTGTAGVT